MGTNGGRAKKPIGLAPFERLVSKRLRIRLAELNLPQKTIAAELEKLGIPETAKGLSAKIKAGTFSAAYYEAVQEVITTLAERKKR